MNLKIENRKSKIENSPVLVLGDGGWGTALAKLLAEKGLDVRLWSAFADYAAVLDRTRVNKKFLPGVAIPASVRISSDIRALADGAGVVAVAIPTIYLRRTLRRLKRDLPRTAVFVCLTKGIENRTLLTGMEVVRDVLAPRRLAGLFGPSHAEEVARGLPTTVVAVSRPRAAAEFVQRLFMAPTLRIYASDDVRGVELGAALKNVIGVASGLCDGLGFGDNTKAALLTRGLAEIARLGVALGARERTFFGLSGMGDLITTCVSPYGRNHAVGVQLGRGRRLPEILAEMEMVAEGINTTRSALALARRHRVEMPITEQVYQILFRAKDPRRAVRDLMLRGAKAEE